MKEKFTAAMAVLLKRITDDKALSANDLAQLARAISDLSYAKNDMDADNTPKSEAK